MTPTNIIDAGDVLVVGAGLAGLYTALKLSHRPVTLIASAGTRKGSSSFWAQGGIAAAIDCRSTALRFEIDPDHT